MRCNWSSGLRALTARAVGMVHESTSRISERWYWHSAIQFVQTMVSEWLHCGVSKQIAECQAL